MIIMKDTAGHEIGVFEIGEWVQTPTCGDGTICAYEYLTPEGQAEVVQSLDEGKIPYRYGVKLEDPSRWPGCALGFTPFFWRREILPVQEVQNV